MVATRVGETFLEGSFPGAISQAVFLEGNFPDTDIREFLLP